eukprot:3883901-Rhodomonas_salina.2
MDHHQSSIINRHRTERRPGLMRSTGAVGPESRTCMRDIPAMIPENVASDSLKRYLLHSSLTPQVRESGNSGKRGHSVLGRSTKCRKGNARAYALGEYRTCRSGCVGR